MLFYFNRVLSVALPTLVIFSLLVQEHESQCPDRHSFDASFCKFSDEPSSTIPLEDIDLPAPADNWEDVSTYILLSFFSP